MGSPLTCSYDGILGPSRGNRSRDVLVPTDQLQHTLDALRTSIAAADPASA
ncbi:MAG: hypothetical protein ACJ72W_00930 [Actinoallomurus sp.]